MCQSSDLHKAGKVLTRGSDIGNFFSRESRDEMNLRNERLQSLGWVVDYLYT
jgi:hypothetical protein